MKQEEANPDKHRRFQRWHQRSYFSLNIIWFTCKSPFQVIEWQLQFNYFFRASPISSSHLLNNIHLFKYTVTMTWDSIPLLEVNGLSNKVLLTINRTRYLWRQRADTNSIFKEITKIEQYHSITKDFLQDHVDKLIIEEKIINKSTVIKTYKVNTESNGWKRPKFSSFPKWFSSRINSSSRSWKNTLDWFHFAGYQYAQKPQKNQ